MFVYREAIHSSSMSQGCYSAGSPPTPRAAVRRRWSRYNGMIPRSWLIIYHRQELPDLFAALHIKRMMDILQRAVVGPKIAIIVERALGRRRRKVLRHLAPLAPCAQRIHDPPQSLKLTSPIHNFAHIDLALAAAMFGRGNQRFFGRFAVVPTGGPSANKSASHESQMIQQIQLFLGRTLSQILRRRVFDRASTSNPSPPTATSDFVKPYTISLWIDEVGKSAANCLRSSK
jgi:hypothetical protein